MIVEWLPECNLPQAMHTTISRDQCVNARLTFGRHPACQKASIFLLLYLVCPFLFPGFKDSVLILSLMHVLPQPSPPSPPRPPPTLHGHLCA